MFLKLIFKYIFFKNIYFKHIINTVKIYIFFLLSFNFEFKFLKLNFQNDISKSRI